MCVTTIINKEGVVNLGEDESGIGEAECGGKGETRCK